MAIDEHTIEVLGAGYDLYTWSMWEYGVNASATQVCPPDANGYCNVGRHGVTTNSTTNLDSRIVKKFGFIDATGVYPAPGPLDDNYIHITEFDFIIENMEVLLPSHGLYYCLSVAADSSPPTHAVFLWSLHCLLHFKMYLTLPLTPIKGQAFSLYIYGRSACFQFKSL